MNWRAKADYDLHVAAVILQGGGLFLSLAWHVFQKSTYTLVCMIMVFL